MNSINFKNWLDGFIAALDGVPTQEQWEEIKTKIAEVEEPVKTEKQPAIQAPKRKN